MNFLLVEIVDIISLSISSILFIAVIILLFTKNRLPQDTKIVAEQEKNLKQLIMEQSREFENIRLWFKTYTEGQEKLMKSYNEKIESDIRNITTMQKDQLEVSNKRLVELRNSNEQRLDKITEVIEQNLQKMFNYNEQKLEQMRKTVDERLNESLERRFNESFSLMNKQFDKVTLQLGEMKSIASSVGDLQKVLTNVKTRGIFGEVQLASLLEQMLAPSQYATQVQIKEGDNRGGVDFAIYLPGNDNANILLPIDSKFPMEDYLRLVEVSEQGDKQEIDKARKIVEQSVKKQAKSISEKYISPPLTTNFAIMYIATEGLYSELLRNAGLIEQLQREYRIIISGPTTFSAILTSLQMGFKTLSIQKHSTEIWNALTSFKKEFTVFTELLAKTQKKVTEASNTIEDAAKKTRTIERKLNRVTDITAPEEVSLLSNISAIVDDDDDDK
ncbi:MAG: DNA recombination protein RmuC [Tenericutes bacterium HGW-Tenericutes-4]|nr:MAG: DNA recombination protein RmuC [Tenericutes bacterium HGW-Tenericutes-4]